MSSHAPTPVTQILDAVHHGDGKARDQLFQLVYQELRGMASAQLAREPGGRTLQPTALVHEAYMRLFTEAAPHFESRRHFFGAAARAMRQILVDGARKKGRKKRGGFERI